MNKTITGIAALLFFAAVRAQSVPTSAADCPEGTQWWQRAADLGFCATVCTTDADCTGDERCRVLDSGQPLEMVFVDDEAAPDAPAEEIPCEGDEEACAEAAAAAAAAQVDEGDGVVVEDEAVDEVEAPAQLQLCDPFAEIVGAVPTEAEETLSDDESTPDDVVAAP
jgi:hypothetical protein